MDQWKLEERREGALVSPTPFPFRVLSDGRPTAIALTGAGDGLAVSRILRATVVPPAVPMVCPRADDDPNWRTRKHLRIRTDS